MAIETLKKTRELLKAGVLVADAIAQADVERPRGHPSACRAMRHGGRYVLAYPWLLMDFRSPVRLLPGVQDGFNRKGLISDHGEKKQAFSILQKAYKENALAKPE